MPCNDCTPIPCLDCQSTELSLQTLCQEGCEKYIGTVCSLYDGPDITNSNVTIIKGMNLTDLIAQLANNSLDVNVKLAWNSSSRVLSLLKNNTAVSTATITDQDDQYLKLTDTILSIWKPLFTGDNDDDIKINEVDLADIIEETTLTINSDSLVVTPGGTHGHSPTIEIDPSSDADNAFELGSDGKPYVALVDVPLTNVLIPNTSGLSWSRSLVDGVLTLTPSFDFSYIASQVCLICNPTCTTPTNLNVTSI